MPGSRSTLDAVADRLGDARFWGGIATRTSLLALVIGCTGLLLAAIITPAAGLARGLLTMVDEQVLAFPPMPDQLAEPPERSVILARDGSVLAVLHDVENRDVVALAEVPDHVRDAVIATEDADFWNHKGVDWRAIARAGLANYRAGEVTSGASTISQQLVKLLVVGDDPTLDRKLREAVYALELEERLTKEEILEAYLNQAYFGNGVYGVGAAAELYWGKRIGDLTVDEAAVLAGIIRTPARNDPVRHPAEATARRDIVLDQMVRAGYLDAAEAESLQQRPLELNITRLTATQPFLVDYVVHLLKQDPALGEDPASRHENVLRGGLTVHTTLDPGLQDIAGEVIAEVLARDDDPLAALTSVDPRSGEILAVAVGPKPYGRGPGQTQVNPAVAGLGGSGRQPGSSFKTFELVAALEEDISPAYAIDTPSPYEPTDECAPLDPRWRPGNYSDSGGGRMDMAAATARSSNVYFAHLVDLTGPDKLVEAARRMGIRSPLADGVCSTVLGGQEVFPLDMATAYGTLANGGTHCEPYAIDRVVDRAGRTIIRGGQRCSPAVAPGVAARATALLRGPIEHGTATANGQIGRPAAGKTGTTDEHKDAWFVGYVPQLSTAAWVGHEEPRTMTHPRCGAVTGGCLPTIIWQRYMSRALAALDLPPEDFPAPPPLPSARVPDVTGLAQDDAGERLAEALFSVDVEEVDDPAPAGTVVAQRPAGGAEAETGSTVVMSVSDGAGSTAGLPDLVGLSVAEADAELRALGVAGVRAVPVAVDDPALRDRIVSQRPTAGTPLDTVSRVEVEVGAGEVRRFFEDWEPPDLGDIWGEPDG